MIHSLLETAGTAVALDLHFLQQGPPCPHTHLECLADGRLLHCPPLTLVHRLLWDDCRWWGKENENCMTGCTAHQEEDWLVWHVQTKKYV
jgi:hypothetical protein